MAAFSRVNTRGGVDARGDTEDQEHHADSKPQAAVIVELIQQQQICYMPISSHNLLY